MLNSAVLYISNAYMLHLYRHRAHIS